MIGDRHIRFIRFILALCLGLVFLSVGCGGEGGKAGAEKGDGSIGAEDSIARSVIERGPVRFTVEIEPKNARLSDEPKLTLTIEAEEGVKVNKPPFGESIGAFIIRDYHEPLPEIQDGRRVIQQVYTLEPMGTGEFFIFPIPLTFKDERPTGDGKEHTLESEGLKIVVASALETAAPSLDDLRPPIGPLELPESPVSPVWWIAGGCGLLLAAGLIVFLLRRKGRPAPLKKMRTPQELAFLEFKRLLEQGLVDMDVKLFYVQLTGIVRRYIEGTTGIRAPEQTTEEFLRETSRADVFPEEERGRLKQFLEAADLVKFAAFQPGKQEIEMSFERAKAFIGLDTREAAA